MQLIKTQLSQKLDNLKVIIDEIKASQSYQVVSSIDDWQEYFDDQKIELIRERDKLRELIKTRTQSSTNTLDNPPSLVTMLFCHSSNHHEQANFQPQKPLIMGNVCHRSCGIWCAGRAIDRQTINDHTRH